MRSVLFICAGNTCRSPMAAALLKEHIRAAGCNLNHWNIQSAGLSATPGQPASPLTLQVMEEHGLDLSGHRSQQVTLDLISAFDLIFVMEDGQLQALISSYPQLKQRLMLLSQASGRVEDISDPYGGLPEDYRRCASLIDKYITDGLPNFC